MNYDDLMKQTISTIGEDGDFDAAINYINNIVNKNLNIPEAYLVRGELFIEMGNYEKAITDMNKVIGINPNIAQAYYSRGVGYAKLNDNEKAFNDFNKAIELDENYAEAYSNRGNMYLKREEYQKAINDCTKAIEILPDDDISPYYNRGLAYMNNGEIAKAFNDYNKVIELDPKNAEAYAKRGYLNSELGNTQKAISDLEEFIRLEPYNKNAELARDALAELKTNTVPSSVISSGRKNKLILMVVSLSIGGIFGFLLGMNTEYWHIGLLIGAYLGIGIAHVHKIGFWKGIWSISWRAAVRQFNENGLGAGFGQLVFGLIFSFFALFLKILISPFIAVYQLVADKGVEDDLKEIKKYMICPACGKENLSETRFCTGCGAKIVAPASTPAATGGMVCTVCGKENQPGEKFCTGCGKENPPNARFWWR